MKDKPSKNVGGTNELGVRTFPMLNVNGLNVPFFFDEKKVSEALSLAAREADIFVVTYPKCGTTWMRYIVWSIQNFGESPMPSMEQLSYKYAPFLERAGSEAAERLPSPRTLNVHFPYEFMPYHPKARYIYVARDPRDTCVSYYHMAKESLGGSGYMDATFDDFFELFLTGDIPYGDYFDHLLTWFEHKDDDNVLFLTFEQMLLDPADAVLKVARFISDNENDYEKRVTQDNGSLLRTIVENTAFKNMKDMPVVIRSATSTSCGDEALDTGVRVNFFRKGIAGDWINYFSEKQVERLRARMVDKVLGTGIENLWDF